MRFPITLQVADMRRTLTPSNSPVSSPSKHGDRFIPSRAGANWSISFHRINVSTAEILWEEDFVWGRRNSGWRVWEKTLPLLEAWQYCHSSSFFLFCVVSSCFRFPSPLLGPWGSFLLSEWNSFAKHLKWLVSWVASTVCSRHFLRAFGSFSVTSQWDNEEQWVSFILRKILLYNIDFFLTSKMAPLAGGGYVVGCTLGTGMVGVCGHVFQGVPQIFSSVLGFHSRRVGVHGWVSQVQSRFSAGWRFL